MAQINDKMRVCIIAIMKSPCMYTGLEAGTDAREGPGRN